MATRAFIAGALMLAAGQAAQAQVYIQPGYGAYAQGQAQVIYVNPVAGSKRTVHGNYAQGGVAFQPSANPAARHTYRWVSVLGHQAAPHTGYAYNPSQAPGPTQGFQNGFGPIYGNNVERVIAGTIQPAPVPVNGRIEGYFLPFPKYVNWKNNPNGLYPWEQGY